MNEPPVSLTAVDVIRCVYLARVAQQRGDLATAARWQCKADAWLKENVIVPDSYASREEETNE